MQYRVGSWPVARFCPPVIGELDVRYLTYIPPLVNFFHRCMQQTAPRPFLFIDQGDLPWPPAVFTRGLQPHTTLSMGITINSGQWRHLGIALARRILQGIGCQLHGVAETWDWCALRAGSGSDSDTDIPGSRRPTWKSPGPRLKVTPFITFRLRILRRWA